MLLKRMVPHVPKTIPQDDSQRVFEDNNAHLYVRALVHLQNDINTDKMEKEPSFSAHEITNTTLVIRVQERNFACSFVHSYIHSTNISQTTILFQTLCQVLKTQQQQQQKQQQDTVLSLKAFPVQ